MLIETPRFVLRDFSEADRQSFIDYQMDPRYQAVYDWIDTEPRRANELFDLFRVWRQQNPRQNFQVGIFERTSSRLCGCVGLRQAGKPEGAAVFGLERRYGVAIEVTCALIEHGFRTLTLHTIIGDTASGNSRAERLARWSGAVIVGHRDGPTWMIARGWKEVDWALSRDAWEASPGRRRFLKTN
jgi:[ribosomal protein S5]-alanine N-acetyltransferase